MNMLKDGWLRSSRRGDLALVAEETGPSERGRAVALGAVEGLPASRVVLMPGHEEFKHSEN